MLAGWLVAFIAMQMASTLRAGRNERKRGSRAREREETSGSGSEREGEIIGGCCRCCCCCCRRCCRCCVRVHALFPASLSMPLASPQLPPPASLSPLPPAVHSHVDTVDQSPRCLFLLMRNANIRVYISACVYARARV